MVDKLVSYLKSCDDAYYNSDEVVVNNDTYDALVETLRRLNPEHPYLQKVGAKVKSNKLGRLIPMGTLSKYHKDEEILKWLKSEGGEILLAPKYDGFAIELVYQDGNLISASTRGDGNVGEDVLSAIMRIQNIPISIPFSGEIIVRGEAIIPAIHHDKIKELGYSAMRNAVPGIVRSNRVDALQYVDFIAYEFIDNSRDRIVQRFKYKDIFTIEDWTQYSAGVASEFEGMKLRRQGLRNGNCPYDIDGVVLKTVEIKEDDLLNPSHMIAWKYKSNRETTILRDIEFNVGATGAISVVGIFDEVEFQGAKLKRASFGSLPLYEEMKPAVGDIIEVSRRGDIIPWIEEVVVRNSENYKELTTCPCCGTPLKDSRCPNTECPERVKLKIYQFVKSIGVKGIGYSLVVALVDAGIIKSLKDVYDMNADDILNLPRQGKSSVEKWNVLQTKEISTFEFLCAYPFENAGKSLWKSILNKFSVDEILNFEEKTLEDASIKGLGSSKIQSIVSQIRENKEELQYLLDKFNSK